MDPELALNINRLIDRVHSPYYWAFPSVLAVFSALEVFLPAKAYYLNRFDKYLTYCKFALIIFFTLIATSQGFTGGCVLHLLQNWLAQNYLHMEYWNAPYGPVYREYVPRDWEWVLRVSYFLGAWLSLAAAWQYYKKFIHSTKLSQ